MYGEIPAPDGAPTVLLYAHHDVQATRPPTNCGDTRFPSSRRRSTDASSVVEPPTTSRASLCTPARCGLTMGEPPVGVKVFLEGEEEIGSLNLDAFLARYQDLLASDAIVIADSGTWRVGEPGLTTSLPRTRRLHDRGQYVAERCPFGHVGRSGPGCPHGVGQIAGDAAR